MRLRRRCCYGWDGEGKVEDEGGNNGDMVREEVVPGYFMVDGGLRDR